MKLSKLLAASAAAIALTAGYAGSALAQSTTADIRGVVTDASGAPVSGATVTVTDSRTGLSRTVQTGSGGNYSVRGLDAGGNYTVSVDTDRYADEQVTDIRLSLGDTTVVNFDLAGAATDDTIVVVSTRSSGIEVATGPAATFDYDALQNTPALERDIKDIVKTDPRLFIDESFGNGLQCAGASPRFNSLTVDGIKLNDNFGLNANGYPTERLPFPYDAINQVAVELAPFDVEYGGFTGCNINAVTRSGTNEFHGSAWADWTTDALRGGVIDGSAFDKGNYNEIRFGATVSGPIWKDRIHFFAAYEKVNETEILARGPADIGSVGVQGVTQAQLDLIKSLAQSVYGYTPLDLPASFGEDDEKILVRLDFNLLDNHRAAFTYNYNNGFNLTASDSGPDNYEFFDHYYLRSTKLTSYSGQIFSDWTDTFSTEARVSYTTNDTGQNSVNGTDMGEIQIRTFNNGRFATVYMGSDDSRHSNKLDTKTLNLKFLADWDVNNHKFTFGYEREQVEVFNLFIQHTEGEYRFDRITTQGANPANINITDFQIGFIDDIFYGNAGVTNNPDDGAANFAFVTNSAYVQDQIATGNWNFTLGVRYDWYTSSDIPALNNNFLARNGFPNTETFDGRGLLQPRFGFDWDATDRFKVHGGAGIFSGGNPNVWLSNSYQNDSITTVQTTRFDRTVGSIVWINDEGGMNRPLWGIPQEMFNEVASGAAANGAVNAVDPEFNIPSQWKAALGFVWDFDALWGFGDNYRLMVDFLYTKDRDAAAIVDAALAQIGTTRDGRPIYRRVDFSDPDCQTNPAGAACTGRGTNNDFLLTNNEGGVQKVASVALSKEYDFDTFRADWTLGYAYMDAKDRNPMTSSVAFSNYANFSTADPNNPALANSNYEVPHRLTFKLGMAKKFFGEHETKLNLFGVLQQSRPYSFIFGDGGDTFGDSVDFRHLFYVPTGPADPNVRFAPSFTPAMQTQFFQMLTNLGLDEYAGTTIPRNEFQSDWYSQWDLRLEQEIPGLFRGNQGAIFVIIDNLGNLIDDSWGVARQAGFPGSVALANLNETVGCAVACAAGSRFGPNGEYVLTGFNNVTPATIQAPITNVSVWEIRFGVRYSF